MTTLYRTYEEPLENRVFTESQMKEVYRDMADKTEYQSFDIWLDDMIKSGVFEKYTARSLFERYIDDIEQFIEYEEGVETIVFHILDREDMKYRDVWQMADELDDLILAKASEM